MIYPVATTSTKLAGQKLQKIVEYINKTPKQKTVGNIPKQKKESLSTVLTGLLNKTNS